MMLNINYYIERLGPYTITAMFTYLIKMKDIKFVNNKNKLIILIIVAILISLTMKFMSNKILSMKIKSEFIEYIIDKDEKQLFNKYVNITIIVGLLNAGISLIMWFNNNLYTTILQSPVYYAWIAMIILFTMLTVRSLIFMTIMIINKDSKANYVINDYVIKTDKENLNLNNEHDNKTSI